MAMNRNNLRIAIGGFGAESNAFSFEKGGDLSLDSSRGTTRPITDATLTDEDELISANRNKKTVVGGFISELETKPTNLLPLPRFWWGATGVIAKGPYERAKRRMIGLVRKYARVDAILLDLHGAMQAEGVEDAEGVLLKELRSVVGRKSPMVCVVDKHANITDLKVEMCDMIFPYKTNPHIDLYERGSKAARFLLEMMNNGIHPTMHLERLPMLGNNLGMSTWASTPKAQSRLPMDSIERKATELENRKGVIDVSVIIGFGQANIHQCVTSVLAITDADRGLAKELAVEIATLVWKARDDFLAVRPLLPVDEAIDEALRTSGRPIILVDVGDNSGGGAPCDNNVILEALLRKKVHDAVVPLRDPDAVAKAFRAGVGATIETEVGGKLDNRFYKPVAIKARVKLLSDGIYIIRGPSHGGFGPKDVAKDGGEMADVGRMALLSTGLVDVIVSEGKVAMERDYYKAAGVDPSERKIVVVKSHQAHRASFEPIAQRIIEVDTPGITSPLFRGLTLKYPPRGSYTGAENPK